MNLVDELRAIQELKFSFGKANERQEIFCAQIEANSMFMQNGWGLNIPDNYPDEMKIRAIFPIIYRAGGIFIFNITSVDLKAAKDGFYDWDDALDKSKITEWELNYIIWDVNYLNRTIFHNGSVIFNQGNALRHMSWNY